METKPWQIPYPMENWKMRYMVVWIQNHDKFIVLIWKTLDMRYNCPNTEKYRVNKIHIGRGEAKPDMSFIDPIFSVLEQLYTV
jgi:hypothetical protein